MLLKQLYAGSRDIDARVLKSYRLYAEKWEARGHGSYGLPLFATQLFSSPIRFDLTDTTLNIAGFVTTVKPPKNSFLTDLTEYAEAYNNGKITLFEYFERGLSRVFVTLTYPLWGVWQKFFPTPTTAEGNPLDVTTMDPTSNTFWAINRHLRLPLLIAGSGFLAKGAYSLVYSLVNSEPYYAGAELDLQQGLGFLLTASSAYFKDKGDPNLGKKQKSLSQLAKESLERLIGKIPVLQPIPQQVTANVSLEEMIQSE